MKRAIAIAVVIVATAAPAHARTAPSRATVTHLAPTSARTAPSRATVTHLASSSARAGRQIRLVAVVDHAWTEKALVVRYRRHQSHGPFGTAPFERSSAGGYYAVIPAATWAPRRWRTRARACGCACSGIR